jgi:hypothetical protein
VDGLAYLASGEAAMVHDTAFCVDGVITATRLG